MRVLVIVINITINHKSCGGVRELPSFQRDWGGTERQKTHIGSREHLRTPSLDHLSPDWQMHDHQDSSDKTSAGSGLPVIRSERAHKASENIRETAISLSIPA